MWLRRLLRRWLYVKADHLSPGDGSANCVHGLMSALNYLPKYEADTPGQLFRL